MYVPKLYRLRGREACTRRSVFRQIGVATEFRTGLIVKPDTVSVTQAPQEFLTPNASDNRREKRKPTRSDWFRSEIVYADIDRLVVVVEPLNPYYHLPLLSSRRRITRRTGGEKTFGKRTDKRRARVRRWTTNCTRGNFFRRVRSGRTGKRTPPPHRRAPDERIRPVTFLYARDFGSSICRRGSNENRARLTKKLPYRTTCAISGQWIVREK